MINTTIKGLGPWPNPFLFSKNKASYDLVACDCS